MKKVLITGVNSYIGNCLTNWLNQYPEHYIIDKVSMRDDKWKQLSLKQYDTIVHVAGKAHVTNNPDMADEYYRVNTDLTFELAEKAKNEGVKQFIYLSSIIVYGSKKLKNGFIYSDTKPNPDDFYGDSKLKAENKLEVLADSIKIVIIRPPMIYGKGSKGNYPKLAKLAQVTPLFPKIDNKRSMLHIDNLVEFIKLMIDNEEAGLFFPQNKDYVITSEMVKLISSIHNNRMLLVRFFNPIIYLLRNRVGVIKKVFGNLAYDQSMSVYKDNYQIRDLKTSIELTESRE